jgi:transposase
VGKFALHIPLDIHWLSCTVKIYKMEKSLRRAKLSARERNFRSRLAQLATQHNFLRGTLSERAGKCGKANCRCARGERHKSLYLVQSQGGKPRQICVPQAWQARVRQAVQDYRQMQELIEEVSELEWKRLGERKP